MVQFNPENANAVPWRQIVSFWTEKVFFRVSSKCTPSKDLFYDACYLSSCFQYHWPANKELKVANRSRMQTFLLPNTGELCYGSKGSYSPLYSLAWRQRIWPLRWQSWGSNYPLVVLFILRREPLLLFLLSYLIWDCERANFFPHTKKIYCTLT